MYITTNIKNKTQNTTHNIKKRYFFELYHAWKRNNRYRFYQFKMEKDYKRRLPVHKDNIRTWEVKVDNDTLLNFVSFILKDHTKTKIKSMLKHNQFAINSMPTTRFDAPLYRGDKVSINFDKSFKVFSHPRVRLVYEDDDILVINKG